MRATKTQRLIAGDVVEEEQDAFYMPQESFVSISKPESQGIGRLFALP